MKSAWQTSLVTHMSFQPRKGGSLGPNLNLNSTLYQDLEGSTASDCGRLEAVLVSAGLDGATMFGGRSSNGQASCSKGMQLTLFFWGGAQQGDV